ncbi:MAG: polyprenol monophosphomannose synthase, partial [Muribaculaceae bacterium]|nr:polyprenol monophosphomannose synthase [Muribaculaceae bacterium]
ADVLRAFDLDNIRFKGYAFQIEMKFTAHKMNFKVAEVPIVFTNRVLGTSKMSGGIFGEAFFGVISMKLRSMFKKYERKNVNS